ncbi:hypothetical protein PVA45_07145 (plasmid) [Entomospira entomophila]|uniref:Uncharacterized protein n=1 Tax=Entomospira entomophila TaxID=2719988 RepID=A0A968GDB2_9SPIO|nr:hypothetical protein [Entomospira entomophilus]NIZ41366.1 hypothetical protein [Entomospira entomophilus]WDI36223.1 hypothetical protein PVA45_07145 [Entomospira entomophilus]
MALIQIQNFIEDDIHQSNSIELMASWQLWLASNDPFLRLDSGSNSFYIESGAFFAMDRPSRWYRTVGENVSITQAQIDVGGNFKAHTSYQIYLVDDGKQGIFLISEDRDAPVGFESHQALWIAQFRTKENGIIEVTSTVDLQMSRGGSMIAIGSPFVQYPGIPSPEDLYPRQQWKNISNQFPGDFFRVEGGLASTFGSGRQEESVPNIKGEYSFFDGVNASIPMGFVHTFFGAFLAKSTSTNRVITHTSGATNLSSGLVFDASRSHPAYGRRNEVAPQNQTIRLWVRVG